MGDERLLGMIYRPKGTLYEPEDEEGSIEGKWGGTQDSREKRGERKKCVQNSKRKTETENRVMAGIIHNQHLHNQANN